MLYVHFTSKVCNRRRSPGCQVRGSGWDPQAVINDFVFPDNVSRGFNWWKDTDHGDMYMNYVIRVANLSEWLRLSSDMASGEPISFWEKWVNVEPSGKLVVTDLNTLTEDVRWTLLSWLAECRKFYRLKPLIDYKLSVCMCDGLIVYLEPNTHLIAS